MSPRPSVEAERVPQILNGACRAIVENGFDRVRFADVAEAAGTSVGTVQHYFDSLDSVLFEAVRHANEQAIRAWRELRLSGDERERIALLLELCAPAKDVSVPHDFFLLNWRLWLEFWPQASRDARLRRDNEDVYEAWASLYRDAIVDGIRNGTFRMQHPVDDLVDQLVAVVDGLAIRVLIGHESMTRERMRHLIFGFAASQLGVAIDELYAAVPERLRNAKAPTEFAGDTPTRKVLDEHRPVVARSRRGRAAGPRHGDEVAPKGRR